MFHLPSQEKSNDQRPKPELGATQGHTAQLPLEQHPQFHTGTTLSEFEQPAHVRVPKASSDLLLSARGDNNSVTF